VRRIPIRAKLAAALSVPMVALFMLSGLEVVHLTSEVDEIENQTEIATAAVGPGGLITHLQNERTFAAVEAVNSDDSLGVRIPVRGYDETRALTDESLAMVRQEIARRGPAVQAAYAPAIEGLEALDRLRADIDANTQLPEYNTEANGNFQNRLYQRYTQMIRPFFDATDKIVRAIDDDELRQGVVQVNTASRNIELFLDLVRTLAVIGGRQGVVDTREEIRDIVSRKVLWDPIVASVTRAKVPYDEVVDDVYPLGFIENVNTLVQRSLTAEDVPIDQLVAPLTGPGWGGLAPYREAMSDKLTEVADSVRADARRREQLFLALAAVTLTVALVLTWLVSRSITRPLRSLTSQAKAMARSRLPAAVREVLQTPLGEDVTVPRVEPVAVKTRDEVLDVSQALNRVQDTALELAVEQAVLRRNMADSFVNLGRRNQNLLARQLDLITALENVEPSSEALANLFRLDHLATRMRRNAESLLVLAGVDPPRQWAQPVSVNDVVRAALGEVEDYQRVAVRDVQAATVVGSLAADLAHLLAELIENALVFSPEDRAVEVRGRAEADGRYTLAIVDRGVGMTAEAMAASNRRLAGHESFTVAPSKYLGHYVAGNLAARHAIAVRLDPSPGRGITATVSLPAELLTAAPMLGAAPVAGPPPAPSRPDPAPAGPGGRGRPGPVPPQVPVGAGAGGRHLHAVPSRPGGWEATPAPPGSGPPAYG
jgi:signal transduction histidine kinase